MLDRRSLLAAAFGWLLWPFAKRKTLTLRYMRYTIDGPIRIEPARPPFVDENGITHHIEPAPSLYSWGPQWDQKENPWLFFRRRRAWALKQHRTDPDYRYLDIAENAYRDEQMFLKAITYVRRYLERHPTTGREA